MERKVALTTGQLVHEDSDKEVDRANRLDGLMSTSCGCPFELDTETYRNILSSSCNGNTPPPSSSSSSSSSSAAAVVHNTTKTAGNKMETHRQQEVFQPW